jgi:hypothetical protein
LHAVPHFRAFDDDGMTREIDTNSKRGGGDHSEEMTAKKPLLGQPSIVDRQSGVMYTDTEFSQLCIWFSRLPEEQTPHDLLVVHC